MTFDDSGMLVLPDDVKEVWKQEEHIVQCSHCGYSYISRAIYKIRHICPRCKEVIY
jgi:predicted Zn-ribbon and HTH transcriptional regulator